jgi:hypothetical protein
MECQKMAPTKFFNKSERKGKMSDKAQDRTQKKTDRMSVHGDHSDPMRLSLLCLGNASFWP